MPRQSLWEDCNSKREAAKMPHSSYIRPRVLLVGGVAIVAAVAIWLALANRNAGAVELAASTTTTTRNAEPVAPTPDAVDKNFYPFGKPKGGVAVKVPPPPTEPTLSPTYATKTTTRIYGADPYEEAV